MVYFVRAMEMHRTSNRTFSPEVYCSDLPEARDRAKCRVRESAPDLMLQVDACLRTNGHIVTKYRCRINRRGELHEYHLN